MNTRLTSSGRAEDILAFCAEYVQYFDAGNVATAFRCLAGKDCRQALRSATFAGLVAKATSISTAFDPKQLTSIAWACATCGFSDAPLLNSLSASFMGRIAQLSPEQLSSIAWAWAKLDCVDQPLMDAIATASMPRLAAFDPQEVSITVWAFARLGLANTPLLTALSPASIARIAQFQPRHLSSTAWACATLAFRDDPLLDAISTTAIRLLAPEAGPRLPGRRSAKGRGDFGSQALANLAWSYAKLGRGDIPLFAAISAASIATITEFSPQGVVNLAWAVAKLACPDSGPLLYAISARVLATLDQFTPQWLGNTAWAFATLSVRDLPLLAAISAAALARMAAFNPQDLANTAWAFATLVVRDLPLITAIAGASQARINDFIAQGLANTVWAVAVLQFRDAPFMSSIAEAALRRLLDYGCQELANTAWAFATLAFAEAPLLDAIAAASLAKISEFDFRDLANTAWAFATLRYADSPLLNAIAATSISRLSRQPEAPMRAEQAADAAVDALSLVEAFAELDHVPERLLEVVAAGLERFGAIGDSIRTCKEALLSLPETPAVAGEPYSLSRRGRLFALWKPPGWAVRADGEGGEEGFVLDGSMIGRGLLLHEWLTARLGGRAECPPVLLDSGATHGLVHRLDRQTSGALLWAADYATLYAARLQFAARAVSKGYVCLACGALPLGPRPLEWPLLEQESSWGMPRSAIAEHGRRSLTEVMSVKHLSGVAGEMCSLVDVRLHTGRLHQIRAHLSHEGAPLIGDELYGGRKVAWCPRIFLHSCQLGIFISGGVLWARPGLPADLAAALSGLAAPDGRGRVGARRAAT